ncbi:MULTISPECIES: hypothetical protein [Methanobacterium]|jgi:replication initiation and membrane attachment protein DnaB|uniref:Uncharacterized protein n=1 Tax=Methanobacterium veterum TaxID=408577 RepID=A0A9E5DHV5_9EURY|nr:MULTISPECIES: hypothetical protein [Methanobacterium]MCZ3364527.1 hypothetical protein [Methanobacterium veterum]MCZ3372280.1 hypothetical protein [Methanobacterium veterum]
MPLPETEYQKLINILNKYKTQYSLTIEEDLNDIIKSIELDAKISHKDLNKAKIKVLNTFKGPEIGVTFED